MSSALNAATLFASNAATAITAAVAMLYVWRVHGREAGVRHWALGFLFSAGSSVSLVLRPYLPLPLSIFGTNYLGVASTALLYVGTARFLSRPVAWRLLAVIYLPAAAAVAWYTLVNDVVAYRNLAYTVAVVATMALQLRDLWQEKPGTGPNVYRFVASCWAIFMAMAVARALVMLQAVPGAPLDPSSALNVAWVLMLQTVVVLSCVGFLLMTSQRLQAQLDTLAGTDELTGLLNRRAFYAQARGRLAQSADSDAALLALDLDRFKAINDRHGHAGGDMVLREFAAAMRARLRPDDLLARAGGEEFWLLLPRTGDAQAADIAERLRAAVEEQPLHMGEEILRVTVSIGRTRIAAGASEDIVDVIARADAALYAAKASGRNRVVGA